MSKNPLLNALAAEVYITGVASFMFFAEKYMSEDPDTIFAPIFMLSLFVLSAAVMAYIFCLWPLKLYLDGEKEAGVKLFLQTLGSFAVLTLTFLVILLLTV